MALMALYTPNIGIHGRIAERNFPHYCEAHGFIEAMKQVGLPDEARVLDSAVFNTPRMLQQPDSFIVHYHSM